MTAHPPSGCPSALASQYLRWRHGESARPPHGAQHTPSASGLHVSPDAARTLALVQRSCAEDCGGGAGPRRPSGTLGAGPVGGFPSMATRELSPGGQGRIDADWTRYEEKSDEGQTTSTHVRAHLVRGTVRAASALASGTAPIGDAHSPDRHEPRIVSYQTRVMEEHKDHGCSSTCSSTPTFVRSRFRLC